MSNFFSSEQVQEGLDEIAELQYEIQKDLAETGLIEAWQKEEQIERMQKLFEKQQLMYVRMKLSDDPKAKSIVKEMKKSLTTLGMPPSMTVEQMFSQMKITLDNLLRALDNRK
tara:strand:- start:65 stop:403 length:339 start_codon:yes stop_codon:yes gene_type:complete